ncbi:MAG: hypothetical protein AAF989_10265 [Planctomycetota bacterium]
MATDPNTKTSPEIQRVAGQQQTRADNMSPIDLPAELKQKVARFRTRLWTLKIWESLSLALIGVLVGFFTVFVMDRFGDTPWTLRLAVFATATLFVALIPFAIQKWVLRRRDLRQVAELLTRTEPSVGDRLLGVVELAENRAEQSKSPAIVKAAITQVAEDVSRRDLRGAIPSPRHVERSVVGAVLVGGLACLFGISAAATSNAWSRFANPWSSTPRYTFTQMEDLPEELIVAHGEPFDLKLKLADSTETKPDVAFASLSGNALSDAGLSDDEFEFRLPGQYRQDDLEISAGDFKGSTRLLPTTRPELSDIEATIHLPDYLRRPEPISRLVRGGALSVLRGSQVSMLVSASRQLNSATINGNEVAVLGDHFRIKNQIVDQRDRVVMDWKDIHGLSPGQPFELELRNIDDQPPMITSEGLPKRKVLLDTDVVAFKAFARDDYGVQRVGLIWEQVDDDGNLVEGGEKLIAQGRPDAGMMELSGTFTAKGLPLISKTIAVRLYVEDYLPERGRVFGAMTVFDVLTADEHAIWIANELARWHRQSLDVRDRELKLFEANKQLRDLAESELNKPETREALKRQARGEQANGRRLTGLVRNGEALLTEAMRNPEIGVGHLEEWAEMMQILKDISGNRMPSVADLLKKGAAADKLAKGSTTASGKQAGQNRLDKSGKSNTEIVGKPKPAVPTLSDIESSQHDFSEQKESPPSKKRSKQGRLTLPTTRLAGNGKSDKPAAEPKPNEVEEAVIVQDELLAEFEKVAGKLNELLANMEGSTLVKRLKAASRKQEQVASKLASASASSFGVSQPETPESRETLIALQDQENQYKTEVSYIMDDMAAYFERSRFAQFKTVLDDMRNEDVTTALAELATEIPSETGISIAMAEYWCETMDRWAEDLVEPSMCGACPGCKSKRSLPPSIVLEVLQVLESEVGQRSPHLFGREGVTLICDPGDQVLVPD